MHIILGSQSPRRRELLAGIDIPFTAISIDADESFPSSLQGGEIPLFIARKKAQAYQSQLQPKDILITSDTIVWLEGQVLEKPKNEAAAELMLRQLSGKTHQVFSAVCFTTIDKEIECFVDRTNVTFRILSDEEIHYYVTKYKPLDKAGAYGIQEWIGYIGVTHLDGSYFNVMGFPIERVYAALKRLEQA